MEKQVVYFFLPDLTKKAFVPIITLDIMNTTNKIYSGFMIFVTIWCIGIIAAPALKLAGNNQTAEVLYSFYSRVCHQNDVRSFHAEGEKFGVCIRCSAIYFGFLAGLILMPLFDRIRKQKILNAKRLIIITVPMLIDVLLNNAGIHVSTTKTRLITGFSFGVVVSWFIMPIFIEAVNKLLQGKKSLTGFRSNQVC